MFANKITIPTDGNELTLVEVVSKKDKGKLIRYKYTKSKEKKGMILDLTEKEYEDMIRKQILKTEAYEQENT